MNESTETQEPIRAIWLRDMPRSFNAVDEIRSKRRTVTWIGDELLGPAQDIVKAFEKGKKTRPDIRRFQQSIVRYASHTMKMIGVHALVTDERIIIGKVGDLERILYTEEELREQGTIPQSYEPTTASASPEAREGIGEARRGPDDTGQRGGLSERGREKIQGRPENRSEDHEQGQLSGDAGDDRQD